MHGYLLVKPSPRPSPRGRGRTAADVVFLGDGLEKVEGVKTDFLKNVGKYISHKETLEVFSEFTYAEVYYIKKKNPKLKVKVTLKKDPVDYLRMIKESSEIENVRKSMQIVERVFKLVKHKLKNTNKKRMLTEIELAKFIESSGLKMGANDLSFPAIVASGANAAIPHHVPSAKKLKAGESIILDFGFKYKDYCSDFTRTVFLHHAPKKLAEVYNQTEKAYNESIEFVSLRVHPKQSVSKMRLLRSDALPRNDRGVTGGDVYQKSVDVLKEKNLDKYFIHSLGHGTGLEIHELPNLSPGSKDVMKDNMVFSIEPGVYIPKLGGIRIEDLVYLERGKVKKFINVSTKLEDNVI
jgi:Xaa-Pro aminopeptidase